MAFKKLVRNTHVKVPEVIPDPNQISILDQIAELNRLKDIDVTQSQPADIHVGQLKPDGVVKWSNPLDYYSDKTKIGIVVSIGDFNPLGFNYFGLMLYTMQKPGQGTERRVWLLNQDLSPKEPQQLQTVHVHYLQFVGYAIG